MKKPDKKNIKDIFALTPMQEGMLFHYLKDGGNSLYFEQLCLEISGEIDIKLFEQAWNVVIDTNEMLRTAFRWKKVRKPVQVVFNTYTVKLKYYDLSNRCNSEREKFSDEIITKDRREKFDLSRVPFRVTLCKIDQFKYRMIISNHHILYDGWSNGIILQEFFTVYINLVNKKKPQKAVKSKFKEFVKWLNKQDKQKQEKFWKEYLRDFTEPTILLAKGKAEKEVNAPGNYNITLRKDIRERLERSIQFYKITLAALLYSVWGILLQKYNNIDDVVFGTTISGRSAKIKGIEKIVGLFINTLPLRVHHFPGQRTIDLLHRVHEDLQKREPYESTSLVKIKEYSQLGHNDVLFDSIVVIENYPLDKKLQQAKAGKLSIDSYSIIETTNYGLILGITVSKDITVNFVYHTQLYEPETIESLAHHFTALLEDIIQNPRKKRAELDILSTVEKRQLLLDFNGARADFPKNKTLAQLFEKEVERRPDHTALIGWIPKGETPPTYYDISITYKELNEKSGGLAFLLKERGVFPDTIVAIMAHRSIETIIGILGILKAGGAYLPIDPDYPEERNQYMLKDSGARILLKKSESRNPKSETNPNDPNSNDQNKIAEVTVLNFEHLNFEFVSNFEFRASNFVSSNLAYVIYTSGSTGKPKGVLVEHYSVVNLALSQKSYFNIDENDRILQFSSLCFDASVEQIFIALFSGAVLVLTDKNTLLDNRKFEEFISNQSITHLHAVPSFLSNVKVKDTFKLKRVISGGDVCPVALAKKWSKYCDFYNEYGPTETTVTSIEMKIGFKQVDESLSRLPVGRPIGNTTIYLIDRWMKLVPIGVVGELYIGGEGVARGYLNRPELTAEKFCLRRPGGRFLKKLPPWTPRKNFLLKGSHKDHMQSCNHAAMPTPHHPITPIPHSPIYLTGDLARWLPDGNIEFLGRLDYQLKVRGFRIEPGEIENRLLKHEEIKYAVVTAVEDEVGDRYLCAYIVPVRSRSREAFKGFGLRDYLLKFLPDYMVPAYFIRIDELPLTPTGKIDRSTLPSPEIGPGEQYIAPRDEVERRLADIWGEVLLLSVPISIDDNFFQLGGHSLKAVLLLAKIHKAFNVDLPLAEMFKSPTIRRLSQYIRDAIEEQYLSIEAAEKKEYYTLSSAQKRLYFLHQIDESGTAYNMPSAWVLKRSPDKNRLENTFKALVQRHESLRTSFKMIENEPVQWVHDKTVTGHWSLVIAEAARKEIDDTIKSFVKPFDLSQAPLLRVGLIKLLNTPTAPRGHPSQEGTSERSCILMVDMHHIISDGLSSGVLLQDFAALYPGDGLPGMRIQYKDYAQWQNCEKESIRVQEQALYWQKEFKAEIPVLDLPTDYVRPTIQLFEGSSLSFEIGREITEPLKVLALEGGATLYMVLLTIYTIFLSKISNQEDIVIGAPVAGRRHADLGKIVGMFVNTLALRNYPAVEKTLIRFLAEVKEKTLQAFENQEYQYEDLVEQVVVNRDVSRNPLFDVSFLFQNMEVSELAIPGLKFTPYEYETFTSKFDLTLESMETEETLLFRFEYNTKLFKPETIERFVNYFKNLVSGIHEDKKRKLSELEIISEEEKHQVLYDFNDTKADYPKDKTLHQLFQEQVERNPHDIALVAPQVKHRTHMTYMTYLSYRELNKKSDQMARLLIKKGVKPDTIVGIIVERSIEMIIGIFGILKAGGAYLPIDPEYPQERINYILADSSAEVLLTTAKLQVKVKAEVEDNFIQPQQLPLQFINIEMELASAFEPHLSTLTSTLTCQVSPANLAYIIYTSGSVGRPKGVLVQHGSVVNILVALFKKYPFSKRDIYLLKTSYMFDVSVSELFGWFLGGGRLAILEPGGEKEPGKILDCIESIGISHINFVPSMFGVFLEVLDTRKIRQLSGLKYIFLAGEALSPYLVNKFKGLNPGIVLENIYGPTESTIYASQYPLSEWKGTGNISIGKPLQNIRLYILGKYDQLQPIGVSGELCISGTGLARGYLNRPQLTAEKYVLATKTQRHKDVYFSWCLGALVAKLYRTGDLARWLPDGNIEFLGRIDHQVKIRGFRIELEEIESQLLTYKGIKDAVVLARGDESGDKYLCAYIVRDGSVPGQAFNSKEIQEYLFKFLPDYMVPFYFIQIDELPLTTTGKTDRRTLPAPEICPGEQYTPPRDEVERRLADIWEEVLLLAVPISIDANFFQLGGHSLRAVILRAKIHKAFNVNLPLAEIFKSSSIRRLSQYIRDAVEEKYLSIETAEKKEYYALSSAQKRLYFLQQMDKDGTAYNMPYAWVLKGSPDKNRLENTFRALILRHESLRTSFKMIEDEPVQRIHDKTATGYWSLDIGEAAGKEIDDTIKGFVKPFDLSQAPLLRVGLIKLLHTLPFGHPSQEGSSEGSCIMIVDMHHIISDGMSAGVLVQNFAALYAGNTLPKMRLQYKDYATWQNRDKERTRVQEQALYWQREFKAEPPVLKLPTDYARPAVQRFEGSSVRFEIDRQHTSHLNALASGEGGTLYIVLLALYTIFLSKISNQEDIVVGTPMIGRKHADFDKIIGMFVNTLPIRNYLPGEKKFTAFLAEVKEKTLRAFENQEYPYEDLVENVTVNKDVSRNPLFDACFLLQNMDDTALKIPRLQLSPYETQTTTSKFDLTLEGMEVEGRLQFCFYYTTQLFKEKTIKIFINYFKTVVSCVNRDPSGKIKDIEIISEEERNRLLYDFNNTFAQYPRDKVIHELFQEQVEKTPDYVALVGQSAGHEAQGEDEKRSALCAVHCAITYRELDKRSNRLGNSLIEKGIGPDTIAAAMMERSTDMIVGILGILKAGGAYLPIDPNYPKERVNYILADSAAKILLTSDAINRVPTPPHLHLSPAPATAVSSSSTLTSTLTCQVSPANLAYIIYTSGSTGTPKGVMIEHRSLVNLCCWHNRYFSVTAGDRATQFASSVFDASVWEIFPYLICGASLYVIRDEIKSDLSMLNYQFEKNDITIGFLPTQMCEQFFELENKSLRIILTGGDKLNQYKQQAYRLVNNYGPTENTVVTTSFLVDDQYENIPIGKPISNTRVYLLDKYSKYQPVGIAGELCISGDSLARGYLNNPELTAEKFDHDLWDLQDYHDEEKKVPGKRIYKTGDLARWLPQGNIEFLGRIDHQVQLRGFRIELGEIETRLLTSTYVKEAVVTAREDETGAKYLCAYIVPANPSAFGPSPGMAERLKKHLLQVLPDYMIPSFFVSLEKIPLTPNGKVNRRALPEPIRESGENYRAPRDKLEEILAEIWGQLLNYSQSRAGIDDNFFERGGHSLKAMVLVDRIHKELDVTIPLAEVFKTPTIRGAADYIRNRKRDRYASIEPAEEKDYYVLSSTQKRLYILHQLESGRTSYNTPTILPLKEVNIEVEKVEETFKKLIARHESLRTSFEIVEGEPVQRVHKEVEFEIEGYPVEDGDNEGTGGLAPLSIKNFIRPFDLSQAPLMRVGLIRTEPGKWLLLLDMHHIITDAASQEILTREFFALSRGEELSGLRLRYKDYAQWRNSRKHHELMKQQEANWLQRFSDELPVLNLPTDYPRPEMQSFAGSSVPFELNETETKHLKDISREAGATPYMSILAVFNILLSKLSGQEDIIVGTPTAARRHADLQHIVGMFVNTLAIRNYPSGHKTFINFLKEVKEQMLNAYENQDYAFEDLVNKISLRRDTSRNPIFDVMFGFWDQSGYVDDFSTIYEKSEYKYDTNTAKFDLNLAAVDTGERFLFGLEYCTKLFKIDTIYRIIEYFKKIIGLLPENKEQRLANFEIITGKEKKQVLIEFNDTKADFPADKTLHQLFEEQVEHSPHRIALIYRDHLLTYRELNKKSNQMANHLRVKGVKPDEVVGLMIKRSNEMVIGMVAIMKAGGAYLPLDPGYPEERKKYMVIDSAVKIVLTNYDIEKDSYDFWREKEIIDLRDKYIYRGDNKNPKPVNKTSDLAYVMYTSGSTGKPKGVILEHRNLVNLLIYGFEFTNLDFSSILQFSTTCFDASFHEIFSALLSGGKLISIDRETRANIPGLFAVIEKISIKTLFLPISFLKVIFNDEYYAKCFPGCVVHIQTAGEQVVISDQFRQYLQENNIYLHNHYGPTETHVVTTLTLDPSGEIPGLPSIGKPVSNTEIYILDKYNHLQPVGVTGELYIGGIQVGRGYLNRPQLTADKFLPVSYSFYRSNRSYKSYFLYRTGDLSRWLPDGNIEFLGRIDHQVKIRGYRVEPGEIENQLLKYKDIKETVVLVKGGETADKYLCAYVVPIGPGVFPDSASMESVLKKYLSGALPDYMVPGRLVLLEEIPLTPNGKIDRKALPEPGARGTGKDYTAPGNEIEKKLVDIWEKELGTAPIGIHDNFFELGGHSLAAIRALNKIHKTFGVELTIRDLFQFSYIAGLARLIQKGSVTGCEEIEKQPDQPYYELSYSQKRLWYITRQEPDSPLFNMPLQLTLHEAVDEAMVGKTLEQLADRHESLRTSLKVIDKNPVQVVEPPGQLKLKIEVLDRSQLQWDEKELKDSRDKVITEESSYIFNLEAVPLFRVRLIKWKAEEYDLVFNMHHLISDGWSLEILKHEFNCFYEANKKGIACEMEPLRLQYKDYAAWQNRLLADEEKMASPKEFWKNQLLGTLPVLNLPYDFSRPGDSKESAAYRWVIHEELTLRLRQMAIDCRASLFMVLLAGFNIFLSKITGQEEIIIAIPAAARQHEELKNIVGLFVNTLIIRTNVNAEEDFADFFKHLQDNTLKILEYQGIPLELICGQLKIKYPTIPVFFNMTNTGTGNLEKLTNLKDFHMEKVQDAKFDMVCYVNEYQNGIEINCHYFKDRFKPLSIEKLMKLYEKILVNISAEPAKKIEEYTLTGKEKTLKRKSRAGAGTVKRIIKK